MGLFLAIAIDEASLKEACHSILLDSFVLCTLIFSTCGIEAHPNIEKKKI
jgi:hypothetical protein